MAPIPNDQQLREALIEATCQIFRVESANTTVNKVRKQAEENLDLEEGFFVNKDWKQMSKELIKEYVAKLYEGWEPETEKAASISETTATSSSNKSRGNIKKRASSEEQSPEPKRRKRNSTTKKSNLKDESSDEDKFSDSEEEEKPRKKTTKAKSAKPKSRVKAQSSDEEDAGPRSKKGRGRAVLDDEDSDVKSEIDIKDKKEEEDSDEFKDVAKKSDSVEPEDKSTVKKRRLSDEEMKLDSPIEKEEEDAKPVVDEEDEYSDVIDEPPKPKGKRGASKKDATTKTKKAAGPSKKAVPSVPDDPKEAEIKKLQGHLVKCGVRKLWHNELKKYGDDDRAKIRHLKKMLTDIGMDGRFSEARAREIKESRELLAEVEAAQDMDSLWGTSGRASRSRGKAAKSMKVDSESDEESGSEVKQHVDSGEEEDEVMPAAAAKRRARADLAFLGDDSDSD